MSGFPYLRIPWNFTEPENLEHIISVLLIFWRDCAQNWPLWIGPRQFLNFLLYWSPGKTQSLSFLDQVKQFILASGSLNFNDIFVIFDCDQGEAFCHPCGLTVRYHQRVSHKSLTIEMMSHPSACSVSVNACGASMRQKRWIWRIDRK